MFQCSPENLECNNFPTYVLFSFLFCELQTFRTLLNDIGSFSSVFFGMAYVKGICNHWYSKLMKSVEFIGSPSTSFNVILLSQKEKCINTWCPPPFFSNFYSVQQMFFSMMISTISTHGIQYQLRPIHDPFTNSVSLQSLQLSYNGWAESILDCTLFSTDLPFSNFFKA